MSTHELPPEIIESLRAANGLPIGDLLKAARITRPTYWRWLNTGRQPNPHLLTSLNRAARELGLIPEPKRRQRAA